jgi:endoglucanase
LAAIRGYDLVHTLDFLFGRMKLLVTLALTFFLTAMVQAVPPIARGLTILRGLNLSGLELNPGASPGRPNTDYVAPTDAEFEALGHDGFTVVRVPALWERLQPALGGKLDASALDLLRHIIATAHANGLRVIIDIHDYGRYRGALIGSAQVPVAQFAAFWAAMARAFAADPQVLFGLMNEPHDIDARRWAQAEQAAIDAIRAAHARNLILVSGSGWDGAHNFVSGAGYGTPNAVALATLHDPNRDMAVEMHEYLDRDFSGTHPDCTTGADAVRIMHPATDWLRQHHWRGFLGEIGASAQPRCLETLRHVLDYVDRNPGAWLGWAYWAAGPWWGNYMFSAEPNRARPQLQVLKSLLH